MSGQSDVGSSQKKRSANFTPEERRLLISLANKFPRVLESKKMDTIMCAEKNKAWSIIQEQFNAAGIGPPRDAKALKMKYEGVKKELRKKDNEWRQTGGGPQSENPSHCVSEEESILMDTMALSVRGLQPEGGDGDVDDALDGVSPVEIKQEAASPVPSPSTSLSVPVSVAPAMTYPTTSDSGVATNPIPSTPLDESRPQPVLRKKKSIQSASGRFEALAEIKIENEKLKRKLLELQIHEAELRVALVETQLAAAQVRREEREDH